MKAIVFYHANCTDGFGSAWAFKKSLCAVDYGSNMEFYPVSYGKPTPEITPGPDVDIFILDFSYPRSVLSALSALVNTVTVLDHHKTAQEDLTGWEDKPKNLHIHFDMNRSGAGITWDHFNPGRPRPRIINYIEDRDLWRFALERSVEINAPILLVPSGDFEAMDKMAVMVETDPDGVYKQGLILKTQKDIYVQQIAKEARKCSFETSPGEWVHGLVANSTPQFASDVGDILAKRSLTFGATYFTDGEDRTVFSLRSIGDFDVSKLARLFGGGGHKNAAGFTLGPDSEQKSGITLWKLPQ